VYDLRILKEALNRQNSGVLLEGFEERRSNLIFRIGKARRGPSARRGTSARRGPSEGSIHKVRVASRQFLAALGLLGMYVTSGDVEGRDAEGRKAEKVRGNVRECLKGLGQMRDIQVQANRTSELIPDFPQLVGFLEELRSREKRLSRAAARDLRKLKTARFEKHTDALVERFVDHAVRESDDTTHVRLAHMLGTAHEAVIRYREDIDAEVPRSIHRMRVKFKKFRYMAELAAPLFDQLSATRLDAMRSLQTRMGEIQDLDTLLVSMMGFRERSGQTSLLVAENELRRRRRGRIQEFTQMADEVRFFWGVAERRRATNPGARTGEAG
jgi:CHAD domain-containing protein